MRNHQTDQMGINLSSDFVLSGDTIEEYFSRFEDLLGDIKQSTFIDFAGRETVETHCNIFDEGNTYSLYHHSTDPLFIWVKL